MFYLTLLKIWDTRIEPTLQTQICPKMPIYPHKIPIQEGPKMALEVCEKLLYRGCISKCGHIGCSIILSAISMIHPEAKRTLYYFRDTWI